MDAKYTVPLVTDDICSGNFGPSCIEALLHLEYVIDDIFGTLNQKVKDTSEQLLQLKKRANAAQAKVEKVRGRTRATQVFSSSEYPGAENYKAHESFFYSANPKIAYTSKLTKNDSVSKKQRDLKEKLEFFHVKEQRSRVKPYKMGPRPESFEPWPYTISSLCKLEACNTDRNLYGSYKTLDPLDSYFPQGEDVTSINDSQEIEDAPVSIKKEDFMGLSPKDEFLYLPDLSDLPALDLPMEIPSLPGIANDLLYEGDVGPGIAPSFCLPDLPPDISDAPPPSPALPPAAPTSQKEATTPKAEKIVAPPPVVDSTPPPPSPPDPPASDVPPPPPPPPANFSPQAPAKIEVPTAVLSDDRSNLMKAIQAAGGAKNARLRKTTDKKPPKETKTSAPPGGDLMSDLFSKLAQRRKGISGTRESESSGRKDSLDGKKSTMERMSSLIPALPKPEDSDSDKVQSEDDWD